VKLILSRKGFDSSCGGVPSPIFPDGRMVSLPIPGRQSRTRYSEIRWQEAGLGAVVSSLTDGQVAAADYAHLDPDLNRGSLPREQGWRPLFGQTGAAQGHLRKCGVREGDLFLFFGLFRAVLLNRGRLEWDKSSKARHVVWGWLQIGEIVQVDSREAAKYRWAASHPHFQRGADCSNTVYVSQERLTLSGMDTGGLAGAGVFPRFSTKLQLTAPTATLLSQWELPAWFNPSNGRSALTYHGDPSRWQRTERSALLKTVARGQEFVLDCREYPEAGGWLADLLKTGGGG
jgi:hypothetical protein